MTHLVMPKIALDRPLELLVVLETAAAHFVVVVATVATAVIIPAVAVQ